MIKVVANGAAAVIGDTQDLKCFFSSAAAAFYSSEIFQPDCKSCNSLRNSRSFPWFLRLRGPPPPAFACLSRRSTSAKSRVDRLPEKWSALYVA
jgi:hypothetical protein